MLKSLDYFAVAGRAMRGLRMRLTLIYVILFALVLISLGFVFREALSVVINQQNELMLDQSWNSVRGYLRLQSGELVWAYDPDDSGEAYRVERLRRILLVADPEGRILRDLKRLCRIGRRNPGPD